MSKRIVGHKHAMVIRAWTLAGPLKVLTGCTGCVKTEAIKASRRIRNIPAGFTPISWAAFLDKADARLELEKSNA